MAVKRYDFEWNRSKARPNARKHGVTFERASTTFRDPNALSIPDVDHSLDEERWITIAMDDAGIVLVVIHTFEIIRESVVSIRIISARKATIAELSQYEEGI